MRKLIQFSLATGLLLLASCNLPDLRTASARVDAALAAATQVKADSDAQVKVLEQQAATRPADPLLAKSIADYKAASTQAAPIIDKLALTAADLHARLNAAQSSGDAVTAGLMAGADAGTLIPRYGGLIGSVLGILAAVYQGWRRRRAVADATAQAAAAAQATARGEAIVRSFEAAR